MRMDAPSRILRITVVAVAVTALAGPASARSRFEILEAPAEGHWADFSLSRDGRQMGCIIDGAVYWWSADRGFRFLDRGTPLVGGVGMAADGSAMIAARATGEGAAPAVWLRDGTRIGLDPLPLGGGERRLDAGFDISAGATVAVGRASSGRDEAGFVWRKSGGVHGLPAPADADTRATAVSADGRVVVGVCEHPRAGYGRPALWRGDGDPELILGSEAAGEALGVSLDGTMVVGQADLGGRESQAFLWSPGGGAVALGSLAGLGVESSLARAVSDDGVVVGWSGDALWGRQAAFVWTATAGMRSVAEVLAEAGADLPEGMVLTAAMDISGDGRTIVGVARDADWNLRLWRATIDAGFAGTPPAVRPPAITRSPAATTDSTAVQAADMFEPFPFTRRRY